MESEASPSNVTCSATSHPGHQQQPNSWHDHEAQLPHQTHAAPSSSTCGSLPRQLTPAKMVAAHANDPVISESTSQAAAVASAAAVQRQHASEAAATLLAQGPSPGLQLQMDFLSPKNFQPVGLSCTLLLLQQLGRGGNASVWRVLLQKYLGDGSSAAAQQIRKVEEGSVLAVKLSSGLGYACSAALATEQLVMEATAESQYVLNSYGFGCILLGGAERLPCMLLELSELGSLDKIVRPGGKPVGLGREEASILLRYICNGIADMHEKARAVHRDLKSSNILLFGDPAKPKPKIADFGSAKIQYSMDDLGSTPNVSTRVFAPMEMFQKGVFHDGRVDSFFLGMLLLEMRFGELPFWYLYPQLRSDGEELEQWQVEQLEVRREDLVAELQLDECPYLYDGPHGQCALQPDEIAFLSVCLRQPADTRPSVLALLGMPYMVAAWARIVARDFC